MFHTTYNSSIRLERHQHVWWEMDRTQLVTDHLSHIQNCAVNAIFFSISISSSPLQPALDRALQSSWVIYLQADEKLRSEKNSIVFSHSCERLSSDRIIGGNSNFLLIRQTIQKLNKMMISLQTGRGVIMRLWSVIMMMIAVLIICGHFHRRSKLISNLFLLARSPHSPAPLRTTCMQAEHDRHKIDLSHQKI